MALRCSLLGHDYGDAEVEREREERGSEVVVTVQEYEECARCGDRNVISENTEVTSLSAEADADSLPPESELETETAAPDSDAATVEPPTDSDAATDEAGAEVADTDDAEIVDADADGDGDPAAATAGAEAEADVGVGDDSDDEFDVPTDENGEPVTDDGEILEDEDDGPEPTDRDRDHGEWPDSDDVGPPVGSENEPTEWPDDGDRAAGVDTATDAELEDPIEPDEEVTDDAVVLEDDTSSATGGAGESSAAADARSVTAEPPTGTDPQGAPGAGTESGTGPAEEPATGTGTGTGIERAGSADAPGRIEGPREDVPTEFYCPRCDYVAAGDRPSLRAGDICPECKKGYLGERERR